MRVLVSGATGLIGRRWCRALQLGGHTVSIVSRNPGAVPFKGVAWDRVGEALADVDGVVNLAGTSVAEGRWSPDRKRDILESRVDATRAIVQAMASLEAGARPRVLVNASAAGWYGSRGNTVVDESAESGTGFLADVCRAWEAEAAQAEALGVRTVRLRIGVVMAPAGGALARMLPIFRACLGGALGNGRQYVPWVHIDDVVGIGLEALTNDAYVGAVNATSPHPVTNAAFTVALARAVHRRTALPVPGFVLRLVLGEAASMVLDGQRVDPRVATTHGYTWQHPTIDGALRACLDA